VSDPDTFKGKPVAKMQGKSLKPLLEAQTSTVYGSEEPVAVEMFGNKAVWLGDFKAVQLNNMFGDGKWRLYQIMSNPIEDSKYDVSQKYHALLEKMIKMYDQYAEKVGAIPPDYNKISFPGQVH
jgi:arylsulfatase